MIARGVGCVTRTLGATVSASLPGACVGDGVRIRLRDGALLRGEVAAVERSRAAIVPFGALAGVAVGDRVEIASEALAVPAGFAALGRAFDAAGEPLDGGPPLAAATHRSATGAPPPGERRPVAAPFWTGVCAVDALLTIGRGARVGIFGAPGAGKTTVLETIAAAAACDAVVLALVGERGREAQQWFERLDARMTAVCATSDRSAAERVRAAEVAMTHAQALSAGGLDVVLIVDSLARYAAALRERRVALGEPVGRGGYPPGVWSDLARYLERAGNAGRGSITLIATVLSDGGDEREPLSDAARSLLDGHVVLSSELARAGRFPAIDVLASAARTMEAVVSTSHARDARTVRAALARLHETRDARVLGLLDRADAHLAAAIALEGDLDAFLYRGAVAASGETLRDLRALAARLEPLA